MHQAKKIILKLLPLILIAVIAEALQAQPQRAYERGLEELYRGNTTQALDIWFNGYEDVRYVDARIGFEYIRVVTENRMREYYEPATEMYYRAVLDGDGMDSRVAIRQEINRMRPIIGEGIYRQWVNWWENRDKRLGADMRGFWVQHDPTPSGLSNERLIEHWLRIATARERFTRNSKTAYNTDERALIYIRYGEPDRTRRGILTLQSFNMKQWLRNQLNPYTERDEELRGRDEQSRGHEEDEDLIDRLQDAIYEFHRYPEYEIWFYDRLAVEGSDPIPFIFGTDVRSDEFRLQRSIEDFIPERAFHPERARQKEGVEFTRAGITPALMLQLLYYEQLTQVDPFFNSRLNELQNNVLEQGLEAFRGMDLVFKAESRELLDQRAVRAPVERSTYAEIISSVPIEVYQYRFLDEEHEPYILTYIESEAQEAFLIDYYRNMSRAEADEELGADQNVLQLYPFYELSHTLIEYDEEWNVRQRFSDEPELILRRSATEHTPSRTLFRSRHSGRPFQSATVELNNFDPESRSIHNTPFNQALRGLGKQQFRLPAPLVSHTDSMEVADLVLGFESDEVTEPFAFQVANNAVIPAEETLVLHFEVYNLKRRDDETGFTNFELTYRILPVDEDGNIREGQAEFVLTLNFTNEHRDVIEDLEIETADLGPGLYDLRVRIIDTETGQERERTVRFEVVET
jgi:GWxTD domain-containing protein